MTPNQEEFAAALQRLETRHGHFIVEMTFGDVAIFIAQLQLALRHPGNASYSGQRARDLCENIIKSIEAEEPTLGEVLRMGFDPKHDVPRKPTGGKPSAQPTAWVSRTAPGDERLQWFYQSIGDQVVALVQKQVDAAFPVGADPTTDRYIAAVQAGKALMMTGVSFIGNGLGITDAGRVLPGVAELLGELRAKAESLITEMQSRGR